MAVACLHDKLETGASATKFVASDVLTRLGQITPFTQAIVLKEIVGNSKASAAERIAAMTQLGQVCNGLRLVESNVVPGLSAPERDAYNARSYGATSRDIIDSFKRLALNPGADKNLRGLAAGILFELGANNDADILAQSIGQRALDCASASSLSSATTSYLDQVVQELDATATEDHPVKRIAAIAALEELKGNSPFAGDSGRKRLNQLLLDIITTAHGNDHYSNSVIQAVSMLDLSKPEYLNEAGRAELIKLFQHHDKRSTVLAQTALLNRASEPAACTALFGRSQEAADAINLLLVPPFRVREYPQLRAAAVSALTNLPPSRSGGADGIKLSTRAPQNGKEPFVNYEPDARVRLAAINAMIKIGQGTAPELIAAMEREPDAGIRSKLVQIKVSTDRPVPDWKYFLERDNLTARMIPVHRYSTAECSKWARQTLAETVLRADPEFHDYTVKLPEVVFANGKRETCPTTTMAPCDRPVSLVSEEERNPVPRVQASTRNCHQQRREPVRLNWQTVPHPQWVEFLGVLKNNILKPAGNHDGVAQRKMLIYMLDRRSEIFHGATEEQMESITQTLIDGLCVLLDPGKGSVTEVLGGTQMLMCDHNLPIKYRRQLLETLIGTAEKYPNNTTYREYLGTLARNVLVHDISMTTDQPAQSDRVAFEPRNQFRHRLLDCIEKYRHYESFKLLDAISSVEESVTVANINELQARARNILANWRDSVAAIWRDPQSLAYSRQNLSAVQRAELMKSTLAGESRDKNGNLIDVNCYEMAVEVLRSAKGLPIGANDPRINLVRLCLSNDHRSSDSILLPEDLRTILKEEQRDNLASCKKQWNGSEMVRLSAALVILEGENTGFSLRDRTKAAMICAELAWDGTQYGYRRDAQEMLRQGLSLADNRCAMMGLAARLLSGTGNTDEAFTIFKSHLPDGYEAGETTSDRRVLVGGYLGYLYVNSNPDDRQIIVDQLRGLTGSSAQQSIEVICRQVLSQPGVQPDRAAEACRMLLEIGLHADASADMRRMCLEALTDGCSLPHHDASQLVVARMVATSERLAQSDSQYREKAWLRIAALATREDEPIREKALALLVSAPDQAKQQVNEFLASGVWREVGRANEERAKCLSKYAGIIEHYKKNGLPQTLAERRILDTQGFLARVNAREQLRRMEAMLALDGVENLSATAKMDLVRAYREYGKTLPPANSLAQHFSNCFKAIVDQALQSRPSESAPVLISVLPDLEPERAIAAIDRILCDRSVADSERQAAWARLNLLSSGNDKQVVALAERVLLTQSASLLHDPTYGSESERAIAWSTIARLSQSSDHTIKTKAKAVFQQGIDASLDKCSSQIPAKEREDLLKALNTILDAQDDMTDDELMRALSLAKTTLANSKGHDEERRFAWNVTAKAISSGNRQLIETAQRLVDEYIPRDQADLTKPQQDDWQDILISFHKEFNRLIKRGTTTEAVNFSRAVVKLTERNIADPDLGRDSTIYRHFRAAVARASEPKAPESNEDLPTFHERRASRFLESGKYSDASREFDRAFEFRVALGLDSKSVEAAQLKIGFARRLISAESGITYTLRYFEDAAKILRHHPESEGLAECLRHCHQMDPVGSLWFNSRQEMIEKAIECCEKSGDRCGPALFAETLGRASRERRDPAYLKRLNEKLMALSRKPMNQEETIAVCVEGLYLAAKLPNDDALASCNSLLSLLPGERTGAMDFESASRLSAAVFSAASSLSRAGVDFSALEPIFERALQYLRSGERGASDFHQGYANHLLSAVVIATSPAEKERLQAKAKRYQELADRSRSKNQ